MTQLLASYRWSELSAAQINEVRTAAHEALSSLGPVPHVLSWSAALEVVTAAARTVLGASFTVADGDARTAVEVLLEAAPAVAVLAYVRMALVSSDVRVRAVGVRFCRRAALAEGMAALPPSLLLDRGGSGLLSELVACVADASTEVSEDAGAALVALTTNAAVTRDALCELASALSDALDATEGMGNECNDAVGGSVVLVRLLALVGQACGASEAACAAMAAVPLSGVPPPLARLIASATDSGDPLLQANILALLCPLGGSTRGLHELIYSGALRSLLRAAGLVFDGTLRLDDVGGEVAAALRAFDDESSTGESMGSDPFLGSAALTAVAGVYAAASAAFGASPSLPPSVSPTGCHSSAGWRALQMRVVPALLAYVAATCCNALSDGDAAIASLDALATVAASDKSVVGALLATGSLPPDASAVRQWLELADASAPELRLAALGTLARILHAAPYAPTTSDNANESYLSLVHWMGRACRGDTAAAVDDVLFRALRSAGPAVALDDIGDAARWASYDVLCALAALPGPCGVRAVFSSQRVAAALFDPNTECGSKRGREWQFAVLEAAARNPAVDVALGAPLVAALRAATARGPHWHAMSGGSSSGSGSRVAVSHKRAT